MAASMGRAVSGRWSGISKSIYHVQVGNFVVSGSSRGASRLKRRRRSSTARAAKSAQEHASDHAELTEQQFDQLVEKLIYTATADGILPQDALAALANALGTLSAFAARREGLSVEDVLSATQNSVATFSRIAEAIMKANPDFDPCKLTGTISKVMKKSISGGVSFQSSDRAVAVCGGAAHQQGRLGGGGMSEVSDDPADIIMTRLAAIELRLDAVLANIDAVNARRLAARSRAFDAAIRVGGGRLHRPIRGRRAAAVQQVAGVK